MQCCHGLITLGPHCFHRLFYYLCDDLVITIMVLKVVQMITEIIVIIVNIEQINLIFSK